MLGVRERRSDADRAGRRDFAESIVYSQETSAEISRAEVAGYIAQMAQELKQMAGAARLDILAYLLALASEEAAAAAKQKSSSNQRHSG